MTETALVALGEDVALVLDHSLREQLRLAPGMIVEVSCENGVLTIKPRSGSHSAQAMSFDKAHDDISTRYDAMLKRLS